jgi:hypothetical protein
MGKSPQSLSGDHGSHAPPKAYVQVSLVARTLRNERQTSEAGKATQVPSVDVDHAGIPDGKIPARPRDNVGSGYALRQDQPKLKHLKWCQEARNYVTKPKKLRLGAWVFPAIYYAWLSRREEIK